MDVHGTNLRLAQSLTLSLTRQAVACRPTFRSDVRFPEFPSKVLISGGKGGGGGGEGGEGLRGHVAAAGQADTHLLLTGLLDFILDKHVYMYRAG